MNSAILIAMLSIMAILVTMLSGGQCADNVTDVNVTHITTSSAQLVWQWNFDDDEDNDPIGCTIITREVDKQLQIVHEVELRTTIWNYTVDENLTSWERYESCVRPLQLNGSLGYPACSGYYITDYNPWTQKAEAAVIISAALIFALLIAVAIDSRWPRTTRRTFSMDEDEEGDEEAKHSANAGANINAAFCGDDDDDDDSVVDDWKKAAIAALTSEKTRGEIPWIKSSDTHQQSSTMYDDVNDNHSHKPSIHRQQPESIFVNHDDQPGMQGTEQHTRVYSQQPSIDRQQPENAYPNQPDTDPYTGVYSEAYGALPPGEAYHEIPAHNQQHPYHAVYQNPDYHHYSTHVATIEEKDRYL